jgi:hypothetical protein
VSQANPLPSMVRAITVVALLGCVTVAVFAAAPPVPNEHVLDGLHFKGQTGEKGKGDHHSDTITFENGQFRSLDCENWGFSAAPYSVTKEGGSYLFRALLRSPDRGTLEWQGTITDDKATATFHWKHERWYWDIDRYYWFEGTRQK